MDYVGAIKILTEYTKNDTSLFEHHKRVCENYFDSYNHYTEYGLYLSLLHDLWEDTDLPHDFTDDEYLLKLMELITHNKSLETYEEYIQKIKDNYRQYPEAYYVKLADIKDHLMLEDTLTDRLKEKYVGALRILL